MLEAIKCNKRHSGYEWVTALAQIIRTNANPQDGGTKQRQPARNNSTIRIIGIQRRRNGSPT